MTFEDSLLQVAKLNTKRKTCNRCGRSEHFGVEAPRGVLLDEYLIKTYNHVMENGLCGNCNVEIIDVKKKLYDSTLLAQK